MSAYGNFAESYDTLTSDVDYGALAGYYEKIASEFGAKKGILLDLACGTGSLSIELDKLGYDVIGVDLSPEMLSVAMQKPHDNIEYLCQDMRSLDMYGTIDVTVCALDSINHLESREDILSCFKSVSLFCHPDGLFLFDVNTLKKHREVLANNTFVYDEPGVYCVWQNFYDFEDDSGRVDIYLDIFSENEDGSYLRYSEEFSELALSIEEISDLLSEAGFKILKIYDYMTENDGSEDSEKLLFCCAKKNN